MLGIRRIGAGRADYYLSDLGTELPVTDRGDGRWVGAAAAGLGLDGARAADPSQFRSLLSGQVVATGRGRRVAGYDLTFSAPKSVSAVFALGGEDVAQQVVTAHIEAVGGALRYLEQHGLGAVRSGGAGGEREVISTTGFVGARITHAVNRNLDPHLHSHVVVVNAVHGADGRWSALDGRGLDAHRRAASAVYEAHLREGLRETLAVQWDSPVPGRTGEISGVPAAVLGEFSSRAADVRMEAHRAGARTARGRHVAWAATRPPKVAGTSYREVAADWRRRAGSVGGADLQLGIGGGRRLPTTSYDEHRFAGVIDVTPHGGARRRDVVAAFAGSARDGVSAEALDRVTDFWAPEVGLGVAEALRTRRSVVPANHHLQALGPRPVDPGAHETWLTAARAIDAYRERWGIERAAEPLGADRSLSSMPPARLADHLRVTRQLDVARLALGRRPPAEMELGLER